MLSGNEPLVRNLLEKGLVSFVKSPVLWVGPFITNYLSAAACTKNLNMVRILLPSFAGPRYIMERSEAFCALISKHKSDLGVDVMKEILNLGVDMNQRFQDMPALGTAVRYDNLPAFNFLLSLPTIEGFLNHITPSGDTALKLALIKNQHYIAPLLDAGADISLGCEEANEVG